MPGSGPGVGTVVLVSFITAVAASVATVLVLQRYPLLLGPGPAQAATAAEVQVPAIVGMPRQSADELLKARKLRLVVEAEREDSAAAGSVLEQVPLSGSRLPEGEAVKVVLARASSAVVVPALVGQSLEAAQALLIQVGLKLGEVQESADGEAGKVAATDPVPGSEVPPGSAVPLKVGPRTAEVPDLDNLHVRRAREKIEEAGFTVGGVRERYHARRKAYRVLSQDPAAGKQHTVGGQIDLVVNQGD